MNTGDKDGKRLLPSYQIETETMTAFNVIRIATYLRVSDRGSDHVVSIEQQSRLLRALIRTHPGWLHADDYQDSASGKDLNRPGLQNLLGDAKGGLFDVIAVFSLNQLGQRQNDVNALVDELERQNVNVVSLIEAFDALNPDDRSKLRLDAVTEGNESRVLGERIKDGIARKAQMNKQTSAGAI
jgi:site-specific DNA recombinase